MGENVCGGFENCRCDALLKRLVSTRARQIGSSGRL
jgi:hypothetical protein